MHLHFEAAAAHLATWPAARFTKKKANERGLKSQKIYKKQKQNKNSAKSENKKIQAKRQRLFLDTRAA